MFQWITGKLTGRKRMNPEIKAKWLEDLRSGEYLQGHGRLTTVAEDGTERHCCLGLLCMQAVEAGVIEKKVIDPGYSKKLDAGVAYGTVTVKDGEELHDYASGLLPDVVKDWAGLTSVNPAVRVYVPAGPLTLADANDERGYSFTRIAELIEDYL